jgi:hypothetical protein
MRPAVAHVNAAACGMCVMSVARHPHIAQTGTVDVYTETGAKRVFAGAIEWPGWCRSARNEDDALQALIEYAPRYAQAVAGSRPRFAAPRSVRGLHVVEELEGDSTTDFGAPSIAPAADGRGVGTADLARLQAVLGSCWDAFDRAAQDAAGRELARGPRGGGRALEAIVTHVTEAEASYVARLGTRRPRAAASDPHAALEVRAVIGDALARAVKDGVPDRGPRGGVIWTPRYFVRRTAWHALDHAWEVEDRSGQYPPAKVR